MRIICSLPLCVSLDKSYYDVRRVLGCGPDIASVGGVYGVDLRESEGGINTRAGKQGTRTGIGAAGGRRGTRDTTILSEYNVLGEWQTSERIV